MVLTQLQENQQLEHMGQNPASPPVVHPAGIQGSSNLRMFPAVMARVIPVISTNKSPHRNNMFFIPLK